MRNTRAREVTDLLHAIGRGESRAEQDLMALVYDELLRMARSKMARESPGHTLQPTALVHEAYLRLFQADNLRWENRRHFFAAVAEAMRRILTERARRVGTLKRGGRDRQRVPLEQAMESIAVSDDVDHVELDEALNELQDFDPRACQVLKLRYYIGLTTDEIAEVIGIAPRTVRNDWRASKTWLRQRLGNVSVPDE